MREYIIPSSVIVLGLAIMFIANYSFDQRWEWTLGTGIGGLFMGWGISKLPSLRRWRDS
jgi:hypothetical protein